LGAKGQAHGTSGIVTLFSLIDFIQERVLIEKHAANWSRSLTPQLHSLQAGEGFFFFTPPLLTRAITSDVERQDQRPESKSFSGSSLTATAPSAFGKVFRDCAVCPEMVEIPGGQFMMGSYDGEVDERPAHRISISQPFAAGRFEVTFAEWDACVADRGCNYRPDDMGWGRGSRPVINVSYNDIAREYLPWLSAKTGKQYRFLTEAEWEYAARAGTETVYFWGNEVGHNRANCGGCGSQWDGKQTAPVGSFEPNGFGLHDMHGNVRELVEDDYAHYAEAPSDGAARKIGNYSYRVVRGGSWDDIPKHMRSTGRNSISSVRAAVLGFRVARTLSVSR
jgi:formylglycine-generating enzyme required for sulfatase activity